MILSILKWLGIILLIIIAILIVILSFVLFVPVRYRFAGDYHDDLNGQAIVRWRVLLLKAVASVVDGKLSYTVWLLGGVVLTNTERKLSWIGRRFFSQINDELQQNDAQHDKKSANNKTSFQVIEEDEIVFEDAKSDVVPETNEKREVVRHLDERSHKKKATPKQSLFKRIKMFFANCKKRFQELREKLKKLIIKKDDLLKVYHSKRFEKAKQDLKIYIVDILKIIKPDMLEGNVRFGLEDPATTGQIFGVLALFYSLYSKYLTICPDFEEKCIEGKLKGKGKIRMISVVILGIKIMFNKNLIKVTKKVQTIIEA